VHHDVIHKRFIAPRSSQICQHIVCITFIPTIIEHPPTKLLALCYANMRMMNQKDEFVAVENRIRAFTTILHNLNRQATPSSDPKDAPSFLRHFANLLTTERNVVAVAGFLLPDGITSTFGRHSKSFLQARSDVKNLYIEEVSKSGKPFDEIVNLDR
jgi:hypothetical protein